MEIHLPKNARFSLSHKAFRNEGLSILCDGFNVISLEWLTFLDMPKPKDEVNHFILISGLSGSDVRECPISLNLSNITCHSRRPWVEDMVNLISVQNWRDSNFAGITLTGRTTPAGGGLILDRGTCGFAVRGVSAFRTDNYGVAIAGGCNNRISQCYATGCKNAGFYCHNYYPNDVFVGNSIDEKTCVSRNNGVDFWYDDKQKTKKERRMK